MKRRVLFAALMVVALGVAFQPCAIAGSEKEMKALTDQIEDLWNNKDMTIVDKIYTPETITHNSVMGTNSGLQAIRSWIDLNGVAYPDSKLQLEGHIIQGDMMAVRYTFVATNTGPLGGPRGVSPATGKKVELSGVVIYRVANGKIVEEWHVWNNQDHLRQLGWTFTPPSAATPPAEITKSEKNKANARRNFEEVWNQGKLDVIDEIRTSDFVMHMPGSDLQGTEAYGQYVTIYRTAFPDLKFTIEYQVAVGDKVVTRWSSTGTHKGKLMDIAPTGIQTSSTGISIGRYVGGKCVEAWGNWDALGLWQQLGVVPPIGQGKK